MFKEVPCLNRDFGKRLDSLEVKCNNISESVLERDKEAIVCFIVGSSLPILPHIP